MTKKTISSPTLWFAVALILLLGIVNLLLIRQNFELRKQLLLGARTFDGTTNVLKPGDVVAGVPATDLNANHTKSSTKGMAGTICFFTSRPTVHSVNSNHRCGETCSIRSTPVASQS